MTPLRPPSVATFAPVTALAGEASVATTVRLPDQTRWDCPAAPLLVGALRRRGMTTHAAPLDVRAAGPGEGCSAFVATIRGADGRRLGLAASAVRGGAPELAARDAVVAALAACRPRTVLLASPRSFCAGVERAIEIVQRALDQHAGPVYVRKQIVHNAHVVTELERRGAVFVDELDQVPDGVTVVFSAHGVSPAVRAEADRRGLDVIDATCPLVSKVHAEARRFAARGDTVVFIGHAGHEEVEGTLGEAPDSMMLVETAEEAQRLQVADPEKVSYLTQTTLAVDATTEVVEALRARFPALAGPASDDICYATTNRQRAVSGVLADADLLLVVGSPNSSNSVRLVELAHRQGVPAYLIDDATDIDLAWLSDVGTVGLTAGASAPPLLVDQVVAALSGLGPIQVEERTVAEENIRFALPDKVAHP
ncbi:4-hydroxy-3-methylbut-2-enyl diphosphate reductase [Amycolatopsis benzoatilytica]|uniref:4-hydroxy-3-methylbut-2-enyl diphosphate reductase n=1 Tax=Amycolatopsis benzoatilytica TaxID=346045 RepID=UPI0003A4DA71|nr:4-hydroxy-3-methylbut-2-enyl diphosphate reductase [Amycolatopsis benzoatilytica]